jgi:flagellar protein FlbD
VFAKLDRSSEQNLETIPTRLRHGVDGFWRAASQTLRIVCFSRTAYALQNHRLGARALLHGGISMISVTRLKGQVVALNPDMIESVEENPDTTIRLTSGEKLLVRESLAQVIELVATYRRYLLSALSVQPLSGAFAKHPSQFPGMSNKE